MLSLNPSGKGVCSNFIHLSSVSNRLMFLKNFHHMRFSPLVELKSPNQLIMILQAFDQLAFSFTGRDIKIPILNMPLG